MAAVAIANSQPQQVGSWREVIEMFQQRIQDLSAEQQVLRVSIADLGKLQAQADTRRAQLIVEREALLLAGGKFAPEQGERSLDGKGGDIDIALHASSSRLPELVQQARDAMEVARSTRDADVARLQRLEVPPPAPEVLASPADHLVPVPRWAVRPSAPAAVVSRRAGHELFEAEARGLQVGVFFADEEVSLSL